MAFVNKGSAWTKRKLFKIESARTDNRVELKFDYSLAQRRELQCSVHEYITIYSEILLISLHNKFSEFLVCTFQNMLVA